MRDNYLVHKYYDDAINASIGPGHLGNRLRKKCAENGKSEILAVLRFQNYTKATADEKK